MKGTYNQSLQRTAGGSLRPQAPVPSASLRQPLNSTVKAMKKHGKAVEDVFRIQADFLREEALKIPGFMGRIYVSRLAGYFLDKMAKKGTAEGWQADVVRGRLTDDFDLAVITKKCGLVDYLKSEGMTDYLKYCNFSNFIMFLAMNIGLKQPCTIADGQCVYFMKYKGQSETPASLDGVQHQESGHSAPDWGRPGH